MRSATLFMTIAVFAVAGARILIASAGSPTPAGPTGPGDLPSSAVSP